MHFLFESENETPLIEGITVFAEIILFHIYFTQGWCLLTIKIVSIWSEFTPPFANVIWKVFGQNFGKLEIYSQLYSWVPCTFKYFLPQSEIFASQVKWHSHFQAFIEILLLMLSLIYTFFTSSTSSLVSPYPCQSPLSHLTLACHLPSLLILYSSSLS